MSCYCSNHRFWHVNDVPVPYISCSVFHHQDSPRILLFFFFFFFCPCIPFTCPATTRNGGYQRIRRRESLSISNAYPTICTSANVIGSLNPYQKKIADNKIVVFSKSYCPFCSETKGYFTSRYPLETVEVVECVRPPPSQSTFCFLDETALLSFSNRLDGRDDGSAIQDYLKEKTGGRSVPRTFISRFPFSFLRHRPS